MIWPRRELIRMGLSINPRYFWDSHHQLVRKVSFLPCQYVRCPLGHRVLVPIDPVISSVERVTLRDFAGSRRYKTRPGTYKFDGVSAGKSIILRHRIIQSSQNAEATHALWPTDSALHFTTGCTVARQHRRLRVPYTGVHATYFDSWTIIVYVD
jgi:hypothetical protein